MEIIPRALLFLGVTILLIAPWTKSQLLDPDLIFMDYGLDCSKHGVNLGLVPDIDDWWFINVPCKNYNGSVGCQTEDPVLPGKCECNLGDSAYFDPEIKICLGKVGAYCTAEATSLIGAKLCTPNADCIPVQSEGHSVGTCQCLHGFTADENGSCVVDESIGEVDRGTPRTTTTTEAPDRGPLKLPLNLIFNIQLVEYEGECQGSLFPLLNRTHCESNERTVSCIDKKCQCNMGYDDTVFDKELNQCVGLVGTYCLTRKYLLGYKGCVEGADCFLEDESLDEEHYSFGTCQCLYGYDAQDDGTCLRNSAITNPSTRKPEGPTPSPPPTTPSTRRTTEGHASQIYGGCFNIVSILAILYHLV